MSTPVSANEVLRAFDSDAPYLFLGGAFVAVGIVSGAFAAIRRRQDALLAYFALFAALYGARLWIQSRIVNLAVGYSVPFARLTYAIDYVILIPAFLFFIALGISGPLDRAAGYAIGAAGGALALFTFIFGEVAAFRVVNNVVVIGGIGLFVVRFLAIAKQHRDSQVAADFAVIRWGLLIFVAAAVWVNLAGLFGYRAYRVEPYAFAVFLASLGHVAARRTVHRDRQLSEIQSELEIARRIQLSILPADFPPSPHFSVAARYVPMTSVAGDFYDYVVAEEKKAGLLIADVSGHGVPAALIASMVKLAAASQKARAGDPSAFLSAMNQALLGNTQQQFVTAAYLHLDAGSRELRYSAAGHPPMLMLRGGQVRKIEENGLMLAAFDFAAYTSATQPLLAGDRFLLYTDGILEAADDAGNFLGHDALCRLLRETAALPPTAAADSIMDAVHRWSGKQDDDRTLVVCDYVSHE